MFLLSLFRFDARVFVLNLIPTFWERSDMSRPAKRKIMKKKEKKKKQQQQHMMKAMDEDDEDDVESGVAEKYNLDQV